MVILIRLDFYQKVSEDSGRTLEQWSLKHGNSAKCHGQNVDQYMNFVVLSKTFDTLSRDGHWKIMVKFGYPARFIATISNGAAIH